MSEKVQQEHLVGAGELSVMLDVKPRTILSWARAGIIPSVRVSPKIIRFDITEVFGFLRKEG